MKLIRKIIALIAAAFMVLRILVFNIFAVSAAPVLIGEELSAILLEILLSTGLYTSAELAGKSTQELTNEVRGLLSSDTFPTDDPNAFINLQNSFLNLITSPAANVTGTAVQSISKNAVSDWWEYWYNSAGELADFIYPTISDNGNLIDFGGYGCKVLAQSRNNPNIYNEYYAEYVVIDPACLSGNIVITNDSSNFRFHNFGRHKSVFMSSVNDYVYDTPYDMSTSCYDSVVYLYGDVRAIDGSEIDTDGDEILVLGEADGTEVTPDMLNPDGTVTIDGTTYYPEDFIDWEKLKDPAIIDLLNEILEAIDNAPVVDQDKDTAQDLVGDVSVDLDIGELNNFQMPVAIADVFPFCLPFDFVRGIKGLVVRPQIPVFKSELDLTNFCGYNLGKHTIEISLEKWEPAVVVFRWFSLLSFSFSLILLSSIIVKGAGA